MARSKKLAQKSPNLCVQASLVASILLLLAVPLLATQANYRLCFPPVVGLPVLNPPQPDPCTGQPIVPNQAPVIDGCIDGDPGWTGAWRYVFGNGTAFPNVAVQGIKDNSFLYLSFEVNHDHTYDTRDVVILTLSPTANSADDIRLHIYPNNECIMPYTGPGCLSSPEPVGTPPPLVEYWKDSSTWNTGGPCNNVAGTSRCPDGKLVNGVASGTLPAGFDVKVSNKGVNSSGDVSWFVEMKIQLPTATTFGLYFDVMVVNGNTGTLAEYPWPGVQANGMTGNGIGTAVETNTPSSANWGNGSLDPTATCYGVSLNWSDITSDHSQDQIDVKMGTSNTFTAKLNNSSIDGNGCPIIADQVTAKFSIANFGLPSNKSWNPVPNQTQGAKPIPRGSLSGSGPPPPCSGTLTPGTDSISSSPAWDLNVTDPGDIPNYLAHPDQCILVDLDSQAFGVTFVNKSAKRNMWIVSASHVSKTAEISAKGYEPHPAHKTEQEFILHALSRQEVLNPNQQPLAGTASGKGTSATKEGGKEGGRVTSRLTWGVQGCRLTGGFIIIKAEKLEICEDVGAFGAIVEHIGSSAVTRWQVSLHGPGLTPIKGAKDSYRLRVQQDSTTSVNVGFAPQESKIAVFLDAGAAIPHGTFSNAFNTGFSLNAGLEYIATSQFSVEGIFGFHDFPAKVGSSLDLYQFSANAKFYLTSGGPFRPFVNGGIGGYDFTPGGGTHFGGNVGAGVLREFGPHWGLQASYNFHTVNTPVAATKFSTIQGGIRFVF